MTHRRLTRLLVSIVCGMLLALPASGLAQEATPADRECVPNELDGSCLPLAPEGDRIDRATPVFSNPTSITNPLFPISDLESSLLMGTVDDLPFRVEVTLLPYTKTIEWNGQQVETLVSQYAAYLDGRILEVAVDWYAQADDGSVWYFGEDVFNYEDGVVADTHGTWLTERDGPAGMIMPGNPQVGDVYRPENIPGLVFEEVTVKATGVTVEGPIGPIPGAIVVTELHQDGTYEEKTFAPGYGEFQTGGGGDLEAIALAVPHDAVSGPPATELEAMAMGATAIDEAVQAESWEDVATTLSTMNAAWKTLGAMDTPSWLADQMSAALAGINQSVEAADAAGTRQSAIDVGQAALDLELRHLPITQINLARFDLWVRQVAVDATAGDGPALAGDVATMEWVWGRIAHLADESTAGRVEEGLAALRTAIEAGDLAEATSTAADLRALVQQIDSR